MPIGNGGLHVQKGDVIAEDLTIDGRSQGVKRAAGGGISQQHPERFIVLQLQITGNLKRNGGTVIPFSEIDSAAWKQATDKVKPIGSISSDPDD